MSGVSQGWRAVSDDPGDERVLAFLRNKLASVKGRSVPATSQFLEEFVADQVVLDIGVVEHVIERSFRHDWRHERIRANASRTVGIDIIEDAVRALCERGYDVRLMDATSDEYLGERFSRVIIGDVIEHVDNPVALLRFAARHLAHDGLILCTTPNPFFIGHLVSGFRNPPFIANAEHISWITPTMAMEIGVRANLELSAYHHVQGSGSTFVRKQLVRLLRLLGQSNKEIFAGSYHYVFRKLP